MFETIRKLELAGVFFFVSLAMVTLAMSPSSLKHAKHFSTASLRSLAWGGLLFDLLDGCLHLMIRERFTYWSRRLEDLLVQVRGIEFVAQFVRWLSRPMKLLASLNQRPAASCLLLASMIPQRLFLNSGDYPMIAFLFASAFYIYSSRLRIPRRYQLTLLRVTRYLFLSQRISPSAPFTFVVPMRGDTASNKKNEVADTGTIDRSVRKLYKQARARHTQPPR